MDKFENLLRMDHFIRKYNLPKQTPTETETLNGPISIPRDRVAKIHIVTHSNSIDHLKTRQSQDYLTVQQQAKGKQKVMKWG